MTGETQLSVYKEIAKQGALVLILCIGLFYFYQDNKRHQDRIEKRLTEVEQKVDDCYKDNINILKNQIDKNNLILEKLLKSGGR
jgi:ATP-dependent Zn protease